MTERMSDEELDRLDHSNADTVFPLPIITRLIAETRRAREAEDVSKAMLTDAVRELSKQRDAAIAERDRLKETIALYRAKRAVNGGSGTQSGSKPHSPTPKRPPPLNERSPHE